MHLCIYLFIYIALRKEDALMRRNTGHLNISKMLLSNSHILIGVDLKLLSFNFTQNSNFVCNFELGPNDLFKQNRRPSTPNSPACGSEVKGVTSGCRVAGVQPSPLWNGTQPPREKEMEQEIGLVSLVPPSCVSEQSPSKHARSHTLVQRQA